jgi:hypothetical protein
MRDRIALVLLGAFAMICLGYAWEYAAWSLRAASVPLTFAAVFALVGVGVLCKQSWAYWMGAGVATSMMLLALVLHRIGFVHRPELPVLSFLPVPLFCVLPRRDGTPRRIRGTWFLAGSMLLPAIFIGYDAAYVTLDGGNANPLAVVAVLVALVGAVGLARSRTWGLLAMSLGGGLLCFAVPSAPAWGDVVMLATREVMRGVGLGLACVCLPLALPMWRYVKRPA